MTGPHWGRCRASLTFLERHLGQIGSQRLLHGILGQRRSTQSGKVSQENAQQRPAPATTASNSAPMSAAPGAMSTASQSSPHDSAQLVSKGIWPTNNVIRRRFDPAYASSVCQVCKNIMGRRMGARDWEDMILLRQTRSTDMHSTALLHVSCAQNLLSGAHCTALWRCSHTQCVTDGRERLGG